jgi:repressor LexA
MDAKPTPRQLEFLNFIAGYTMLLRVPPAEADIQRHFQIAPPSVHQMILTLEKRGFISRIPGQARSITVLYPHVQFPGLNAPANPPRKKIKPDETLSLTLSKREQQLLLDDVLCLPPEFENRIRLTIVGKNCLSVRLTLDDLDELGGCVVTTANHAEIAKRQKALYRIFSRIQELLETYTDE